MRSKKVITLAGFGVAAIALAGVVQAASRGAQDDVELITPPGIKLEEVPGPERRGVSKEKKTPGFLPGRGPGRGNRGFLFANADGYTLYTWEKDTAGKSTCDAACAKANPPALAPAGAEASGAWTIIARDDGAKQWAYKGKPVYTSTKDKDVGVTSGAGNGWTIARLEPDTFVQRPYGIGIAEIRTANGYTIVDNFGMPLYAFMGKGEAKLDCVTTVCAQRWEPLAAPNIAQPVGDFTLVSRSDGVRQWAYKGRPLYTYGGDLVVTDAFGVGVNKDFQLAVVARNFQPANAGMFFDPGRGAMIATDKGMTLYRIDSSFHDSSGHGLPGSFPGNPKVGRTMGTASCDDQCLKTWRPFVAPEGALPQGHWSIMVRSNGVRQWAYKGFAAYTYPGDKKPGDRNGSDIYDILVQDDPNVDVYQDDNKYGMKTVRGTDSAANFFVYIEP